ncbi:MAG: succinylglutamate desuccinylase/aspartoacylase family protein [Candidatus Caenarcaniphilales bacterium]|nr:succinylglutamate desuccinylase/aspartoacylase family protein [Candidatus Caenarcaniphilales bacterium]
MKLHCFDSLPEGFLDAKAEDLEKILPGPSLISIPGDETKDPLFLSVLLHGNETTGFYAVQRLLKESEGKLARPLLLFVGNISAAAKALRHLPEQRDYNRIWSGGHSAEQKLATALLEKLREYKLFAGIDIHNNTGNNPYYGCINYLKPEFLNLAREFSSTLVYFIKPDSVLSMALSKLCPAITIECGVSGEEAGIEYVMNFIKHCIDLEDLSSEYATDDLNIYHTIGRIILPQGATLGFGEDLEDLDFSFVQDLDQLNFQDLDPGTVLGWRNNFDLKLSVLDESGEDVSDKYIEYQGREITLQSKITPAMFTLDTEVIHQDCLGYVMEHYLVK